MRISHNIWVSATSSLEPIGLSSHVCCTIQRWQEHIPADIEQSLQKCTEAEREHFDISSPKGPDVEEASWQEGRRDMPLLARHGREQDGDGREGQRGRPRPEAREREGQGGARERMSNWSDWRGESGGGEYYSQADVDHWMERHGRGGGG